MLLKDYLLVILLMFLWGFNFVVVKIGINDMPPLFLCSIRFLCIAPLVFFIKKPDIPWKDIIQIGMLLGVIMFACLLVGMKVGLPAGMSSLICQMQTIFTLIFAYFLLSERPKYYQWTGVLISMLGLIVLCLQMNNDVTFIGLILVLFSAAALGLTNIKMRNLRKIHMGQFIVWMSLVPPIPLFLLSLVFEGWGSISSAMQQATFVDFGCLLYISFAATVLGFWIWGRLLNQYATIKVAPLGLMVPVVGMISSAVILGETMSMMSFVGAIIILFGLSVNFFGQHLYLPIQYIKSYFWINRVV